ncbi:hypothetical protein [Actinomyces oricola]
MRKSKLPRLMAGQFCFCGDLHRGIDVGVERHITWTAVGRFYLALLPLASVLLVVGGITINTVHALGIGPLLRWTWASFIEASTR